MRYLYTFFSLSFSILCSAQLINDLKRDHIWVMGYSSGGPPPSGHTILDFNNNELDIYQEFVPMNLFMTDASICDENGNLFSYTNGIYIENGHFEQMENGNNLNPGDYTSLHSNYGLPIPQACLFLPMPGHDSLFVLIHSLTKIDDDFMGLGMYQIFYSLINQHKNNGLGAVIEKNIEILQDTLDYGKITATRHANGRDWWIVIPERDSNGYYSILLTPDGVKVLEKQEIGLAVESGLGQAVFSPDGTKYVRYDGINITTGNFLNFYDFDRCTGFLSNPTQVNIIDSAWSIGVAISPNSRYVYASSFLHIYQYDLWATDIPASKDTVAIFDNFIGAPPATLPTPFALAQLAPDNKIYLSVPNTVNVLHVIHNPNEKGKACNMEQHGIILPTLNNSSVPNHPNYRLGPIDGSPCDTLGIDNIPVAGFRYEQDTLDPLNVVFTSLSWFEPDNWEWSFDDNEISFEENPVHQYSTPGFYEVCLKVSNEFGEDTYCKNLPIGVSDIHNIDNKSLHFSIFPNPTIGEFTLSFEKPFSGSVRVFDLLGREVLPNTILNFQKAYQMTLPNSLSGIFLVVVFDKGQRLIFKERVVVLR